MERRWCWRCSAERGYLDAAEAALVDELRPASLPRIEAGDDVGTHPFERLRTLLAPAIDLYCRITGEVVGDNLNYAFHILAKALLR